jgi:pectate lyase
MRMIGRLMGLPFRLAMSAAVLTLTGCGDETNDRPPVASDPNPVASAPVPTTSISSLGATGWASTNGGTTGGNGATAAKTYTVSNRNDLIQALYGNGATIADDGGVTGTLDSSRKIIYVNGTINLNVDRLLREYTADEYIRSSCASAQYGFFSEAQLNTAYYAAYRPSVWGNATVPTGVPESARVCAATLQRRVVQVAIPSNTSIIGIGSTARIVNGNLNIGPSAAAPVENIVVRNIGFEDAFDLFPQWDPTDSTTGRWNSAYDLISVQYARRVWIDHNSFSDAARTDDRYPSVWNETVNGVDYRGSDFKVQHHDGAVDVTRNGDLVTVSNNFLANHDKTFLIGGTDTASLTAENPTALRVTYNDNYFLNLRQRLPRVRYGQVHVFNNVYVGSTADPAYPFLIGFTVGQSGKIYAENNVFQVTGATVTLLANASVSAARTAGCRQIGYSEEQCQSTFYAAGTILNGNAVDVQASLLARSSAVTPTRWNPASAYAYVSKPTAGLAQSVLASAGAGKL